MENQKFRLAEDNDGHHYVIPSDKTSEWEDWLEIDGDDERSWTPPEFAKEIDGPHKLVFENWSEEL